MAHGSKKWITDYRGNIKRSRNRTKDDYYGELRWWDGPTTSRGYYLKSRRENVPCPQCKYVRKQLPSIPEYDQYTIAKRRLIVEFETMNDRPSMLDHIAWRVWYDRRMQYVYDRIGEFGPTWAYDDRSYMCYPCEFKYEQQRKMWRDNVHGKKANYQYVIRRNYKKYRNAMKMVMRNAKYNDDRYDELMPYMHEWYN